MCTASVCRSSHDTLYLTGPERPTSRKHIHDTTGLAFATSATNRSTIRADSKTSRRQHPYMKENDRTSYSDFTEMNPRAPSQEWTKLPSKYQGWLYDRDGRPAAETLRIRHKAKYVKWRNVRNHLKFLEERSVR